MPITKERAELAYSMFDLLRVERSGDFKADAETALKKFVTIYNNGKEEDQPNLVYPGAYTKEFGAEVVKAAAHIQDKLDGGLEALESIFPPVRNEARERLDASSKNYDFPAGKDATTETRTKYLRDVIENDLPGAIGAFNEALENGWNVGAKPAEDKPAAETKKDDVAKTKVKNDEVAPSNVAIDNAPDGTTKTQTNTKTNTAAVTGDVAASSKAVETVLQDLIAPLLKKEGVDLKFDGDPDGTFGEDSQIALQKFLVGADLKKIADLGDKPWLYTEANGIELAKGLKAYIRKDPALIVKQVNEGFRANAVLNNEKPQDVVGLKDGKPVWLTEDANENKPLNDAELADLCLLVDPQIDALFGHLSVLEQADILSKKQKASRSDFLPSELNMIITGVFILLEMLGIQLPDGLIDSINAFTTKVFGIDIKEMMPTDPVTGEASLSMFVGGNREDKYAHMQKLYKEALVESGGDASALEKKLKDGMRTILGEDYEGRLAPAMKEAQDVLGEEPEGGYSEDQLRVAAKTFAAVVGDKRTVALDNSSSNGLNSSASTGPARLSVDEILKEGTFHISMLGLPTEYDVDYSDKMYTNPDAGFSEDAGLEDRVEEEIAKMTAVDTPYGKQSPRYVREKAIGRVADSVSRTSEAPQVIVDKNGDVKMLFVDPRRRLQVETIRNVLDQETLAIKNYEAAVRDEITRIRRVEDKIANGNFGDAPKAEMRLDLLGYKANLQALLNQDIDATIERRYQYEVFLEEMAMTEYRVVTPDKAGYEEILRNGIGHSKLNTVEDLEKHFQDKLKNHRHEFVRDENGVHVVPPATTKAEEKAERNAARDARKKERASKKAARQQKRQQKEKPAEKNEKRPGEKGIGATFNKGSEGTAGTGVVSADRTLDDKRMEWKQSMGDINPYVHDRNDPGVKVGVEAGTAT